jgi:DNA-binding response OmpR family regulator
MSKIMLAEDDATMLSLLQTLLQLEGFETVSLKATDDVLDTIRRESPDAVLMDIHLEQGSGLDFLQKIRASEDIKKTVVVMSSGMNLATECRAAGANDFLMKPYMPDDLIRMLKMNIPVS